MTSFWRLAALAAAAVTFAGPAQADPGQLTVDDKARVFSAEGIKKAEDAFRAVEFKAPTQFTVVTYPEIPANKNDALAAAGEDKNKRSRFFREWAQELAARRDARGPFTLISMKPGRVECIDDRQTDVKRNFDDTDLATLSKKFTAPFGEANKADAARKTALHDAALLDATNYVAEQLRNTTVPATSVPAGRANAGAVAAAGDGGGSNLGTYICLGVVGLGALWLIVGVIRAMSNRGPAYGAPGYGGGNPGMGGGYGGGYGGGGGGGGFMSGLMGGMLGGVAGSYLYNNTFGGGSAMGSGYGSTPADGTAAGAGGAVDDGGAGDYAGGGSAGGDFGGDDAGGYSDGGNDYGGGGDSGGGGDF